MLDYCTLLQKDHSTMVAGNLEKYVNDSLEKVERRSANSDTENCSEMDSPENDSAVESEWCFSGPYKDPQDTALNMIRMRLHSYSWLEVDP